MEILRVLFGLFPTYRSRLIFLDFTVCWHYFCDGTFFTHHQWKTLGKKQLSKNGVVSYLTSLMLLLEQALSMGCFLFFSLRAAHCQQHLIGSCRLVMQAASNHPFPLAGLQLLHGIWAACPVVNIFPSPFSGFRVQQVCNSCALFFLSLKISWMTWSNEFVSDWCRTHGCIGEWSLGQRKSGSS